MFNDFKLNRPRIVPFILLALFFVSANFGCSTQTEAPPATAPPSDSKSAPPDVDEIPPDPDFPQGSLPSGSPWLVFAGPESLWAVQADGSGLTQIADEVIKWDRGWESGVAPNGGLVAYISGQDDFYNLALNIYSFETGQSRLITPLVSAELEPVPGSFERVEAIESIAYYDSLAWSPDGSTLAFVGAIDGPSSDLYVYSLADDSVTRLTSGDGQAYQLGWSPDGEYILHYGVATFGTGAGYLLSGTYAARADDSGIITLSGSFSGDERVIGWLDSRNAVVYTWSASCGPHDLRSLNIETGEETVLFAGNLSEALIDPDSGSIIVLVDDLSASCEPNLGQGLHLIPRGGSPFRFVDDDPYTAKWSPETGQFFARTEFGTLAVTTTGDWVQLETLTGNYPSLNPIDMSLAWPGDHGLWLSPFQVTPDGPQPEQVFDQRVLFASWDPSGDYLIFMGEDYISVLHRPSMQILQVAEGIGGRVGVWVYP